MNKLYNEEIKERFLSQYDNLDTQRTIRNVFHKTELPERVLDKDIYEMNLTELGKCIENTSPFTKNVSRSTGRFLSNYISYCVEQGLRNSNINPLKGIEPEWYDQFVSKNKIHYSYDEFIEILEELQNGQDQALLALIWNGVMGEGFSELRELKFKDVDFDNKTVYIKERDKTISLDDFCIKYLEKAYNQKTYYQYNKKTGDYNEKELIESPWVFKNVRSPRVQDAQMLGINVFYNRLHSIRDILDLEFLTPNAIKQSGMIYEAVKQAQQNNGVIAYDQFAVVGEKFNYSTITDEKTNFTYFNTYLLKDFINQQNIKDLYDIDVDIQKR